MTSGATREYVELKQAIYWEYSGSYDEDRKRFVNLQALLQRIDWALEPLLPGQRLLDLGCGSGELLSHAAARILGEVDLVGMDLTLEIVALAKNKGLGCRC